MAVGFRFHACGNNGHAHDAFHAIINGGTKDDGGLLIDFTADVIGRFIDFKQSHIGAAGDVDQHRLRALHGGVFQKRVVDRGFSGIGGAVFTRRFARAHHRLAHFRHDRTDIGEIKVDIARLDHQIGDPAHAFMQDVIGHGKSIRKGGAFIGQTEQILVGDDDQRIDISLQFFDARIGLAHPNRAFKIKRLGDNANSKNTAFARRFCDHGSRASAGAAAHARGDEHHMAVGQFRQDIIKAFLRGNAANFRLRPCAKAFGLLPAQLQFPRR